MFREMRLKSQLLSKEETEEIMNQCSSGVLSVIGDGGYPYGVPMSYVYQNGKLYLHGAMKGHKIDAIIADQKVSFSVIAMDHIAQEEFTTHYRSVIIFGKALIRADDESKREAMKRMVEKYTPDFHQAGLGQIEAQMNAFCVIEIEIEHMTGKKSG